MTGHLYAVYDNLHEEIGRVYQTQRDCRERCDELNAYYTVERFVVEPVPAAEWGVEQVWEAAS